MFDGKEIAIGDYLESVSNVGGIVIDNQEYWCYILVQKGSGWIGTNRSELPPQYRDARLYWMLQENTISIHRPAAVAAVTKPKETGGNCVNCNQFNQYQVKRYLCFSCRSSCAWKYPDL